MTNLPAIACDVCTDPGHCCRNFVLNIDFPKFEGTPLHALVDMARRSAPFIPIEPVEITLEDGSIHRRYAFSCPELKKDGRCGIYAHRPHACREYTPGKDPLCVYGSPPS